MCRMPVLADSSVNLFIAALTLRGASLRVNTLTDLISGLSFLICVITLFIVLGSGYPGDSM